MEKSKRKNPKNEVPDEYAVGTGMETKAMLRALSDGKTGRDWQTIVGAEVRVHQTDGARHRVQLCLSDEERAGGLTTVDLESATLQRDADDDFMLLYISKLLTPAQPLAPNTRAAATVDLDEVIKAVGWVCRSQDERTEKRRRVWDFIKFVSRAEIVGERGVYFDRKTNKPIETFIETAPWSIEDKQFPLDAQPSLFVADEVPLTVTVVASLKWTQLTASVEMAQYLPMGEVLGAIPGGRAAGAWARVIGLALCDFWRRHPHETRLKPTRRELLEKYMPQTGPVEDVLTSSDPRRAVQYWAGALRVLVDCDFLKDDGEAAIPYEDQRDALDGYKWQVKWMNGKTNLLPGPSMQATLAEIADKKIAPKSRDLKQPKRGRPRKIET